jgi:poly-gamma-glutamate synthesis protein (capsule biosynthesis protein)
MRKTINKIILLNFPLFIIIWLAYWKIFLVNQEVKSYSWTITIYEQVENKKTSSKINFEKENEISTIELTQDKTLETVSQNIQNQIITPVIEKNPEIPIYKNEIKISFLWDVMIGWRVKDAIEKHWQSYAFSGTSDYLSKQDAVIFNLETPVTDTWKKFNKKYVFQAKKEHLKWLKTFNDNLYANLANNHFWDYWEEWMINTFKNLTDNWIEYFWAGNNKIEADTVKIIEVEWVKIWLIAQTCVNPVSFWASEEKVGNSRFNKDVIKKEILSAINQWSDIVVYNMHCGTEYTNWPNTKQKDYAYFAIDNWADLVIWHHPHWYQPIEIYNDKLIFYSLWDYIFDIFRGRRTQEGIIANIIITDKKITWSEIIPVYTEWYWNTVISSPEKANFALNELYEISKKLWSIEWIKEGYIDLIKKNDK